MKTPTATMDLSLSFVMEAILTAMSKKSNDMLDAEITNIRVRIGKELFEFEGAEVVLQRARPTPSPVVKSGERTTSTGSKLRLAAFQGAVCLA